MYETLKIFFLVWFVYLLNLGCNKNNPSYPFELFRDTYTHYYNYLNLSTDTIYVLDKIVPYQNLNCDISIIESISADIPSEFQMLFDEVLSEDYSIEPEVILNSTKLVSKLQNSKSFWQNRKSVRLHFGTYRIKDSKAVIFVGYGINRLDHGVDLLLCKYVNGSWKILKKIPTYTA